MKTMNEDTPVVDCADPPADGDGDGGPNERPPVRGGLWAGSESIAGRVDEVLTGFGQD